MIRKNSDVDTVSISHEVADTLRNAGLRVHADDRDLHPDKSTTIGKLKESRSD